MMMNEGIATVHKSGPASIADDASIKRKKKLVKCIREIVHSVHEPKGSQFLKGAVDNVESGKHVFVTKLVETARDIAMFRNCKDIDIGLNRLLG